MLSHELARAIDYYGGMFDENGNINERWTPQTFSNYTETTACLTKQYVDKLKIFKVGNEFLMQKRFHFFKLSFQAST